MKTDTNSCPDPDKTARHVTDHLCSSTFVQNKLKFTTNFAKIFVLNGCFVKTYYARSICNGEVLSLANIVWCQHFSCNEVSACRVFIIIYRFVHVCRNGLCIYFNIDFVINDSRQGRIQTVATVANATVRFLCKNIFNTECDDSKNSL
jgi:hypothetical protein